MAIEWFRNEERADVPHPTRPWAVLKGGASKEHGPATPRHLPPAISKRAVLVGTCNFKVL